MLQAIFKKLFRAKQEPTPTPTPVPVPVPVPAPAPVPATAPAPGKDRRKLKRGKRRGSPGARRIDPNGPWLDQAKGGRNGR